MNLFTFGFAFLFVIFTVTKATAPVFDWNGRPLKVGVAYEMWGVGIGRGPIAIGKPTSPTQRNSYVIDKPYSIIKPYTPDPVVFYPANRSERVVRVGSEYNIVFEGDPFSTWRTYTSNESTDANFITTGGQRGDLGCGNVVTWFQFAAVNIMDSVYKLVSSPRVCDKHQIPEVDVMSVLKEAEDRLCLNLFNELPTRAVEVRFGRSSSNT